MTTAIPCVPFSLSCNGLCTLGAKHIGEGLKNNTALEKHKCAPPARPPAPMQRIAYVRSPSGGLRRRTTYARTHRPLPALCVPFSIGGNKIGAEGAKQIGEALKHNTALKNKKLECVRLSPPAFSLLASRLQRADSRSQRAERLCCLQLGHGRWAWHLARRSCAAAARAAGAALLLLAVAAALSGCHLPYYPIWRAPTDSKSRTLTLLK